MPSKQGQKLDAAISMKWFQSMLPRTHLQVALLSANAPPMAGPVTVPRPHETALQEKS